MLLLLPCLHSQCVRQNLIANGRIFCHEAGLLAEHLPLCYSNRESRQTASIHKLHFCQRLLSMSEKRVKT